MVEDWQKKSYYETRVILETDSVLASAEPGRLVCLSGGQAALLRKMLEYAHRRSTFASEYFATFYAAPTNEEWDELQAIVADLEGQLMSTLCEDLLTEFQTTNTHLADAVTALECICQSSRDVTINNTVVIPEGQTWPTGPYQYNNLVPDDVTVSESYDEACKLAQAWYQAGLEIATERVLPALRYSFDTLLPALFGVITLATGGAGLPAAIGVYAIAELVQEILELGYNVAENNLYNWVLANREELICEMWFAIRDGANMRQAWDSIAAELVDDNPELSDGDELLIKWSYGRLAQAIAKVAQEQNSDWYQSAWEADYCVVCGSPPGEFDWFLPPCPGPFNYQSGGATCWNGRMCLFHGCSAQIRDPYLDAPPVGNYNRADVQVVFTSSKPSGWNVGNCTLYFWTGSGWSPMANQQGIVTHVAAGSTNDVTLTYTISEPGGRNINVAFSGPGGVYDQQPYPLMIEEVHVTFYQV